MPKRGEKVKDSKLQKALAEFEECEWNWINQLDSYTAKAWYPVAWDGFKEWLKVKPGYTGKASEILELRKGHTVADNRFWQVPLGGSSQGVLSKS